MGNTDRAGSLKDGSACRWFLLLLIKKKKQLSREEKHEEKQPEEGRDKMEVIIIS